MIGGPRLSSDIFLISWRMIDMIFLSLWTECVGWQSWRHHQSGRGCFAGLFGAAYSNGSMTIEPVVLRPPMNLCAAAASRSGKVLTTLLATTPRATASNRDFAPASISLRFDM